MVPTQYIGRLKIIKSVATSKAAVEKPMANPGLHSSAVALALVKRMLMGIHWVTVTRKVEIIQTMTILMAIHEAILKARTWKIVRKKKSTDSFALPKRVGINKR